MKNTRQQFSITAAEQVASIFHSFEAGIANVISRFKLRKIILFMRNGYLQN